MGTKLGLCCLAATLVANVGCGASGDDSAPADPYATGLGGVSTGAGGQVGGGGGSVNAGGVSAGSGGAVVGAGGTPVGAGGAAGGVGGTPAGTGGTPSSGCAPGPFTAGARDSRDPLVDGATWTYRHTSAGKPTWSEQRTVRATTYMGQAAFIVEDQADAQGFQTHSTHVVNNTGVYRPYKEVSLQGQGTVQKVTYNPAFLRFDEAWSQDGQSETVNIQETQECVIPGTALKGCSVAGSSTAQKTHVYTVVKACTSVTVPAGTFAAIETDRADTTSGTAAHDYYWNAPGVGKVREEANGEVIELMSYAIP